MSPDGKDVLPNSPPPPAPPRSGGLPPRMSAIRTFRSDITTEISQKNLSESDIAIAEQKKMQERARQLSSSAEGGQGVRIAVIVVVLFFLLGAAGTAYYLVSQPKVEVVGGLAVPETPIFAEKKVQIDLSEIKSVTEGLQKIRTVLRAAAERRHTVEYLYFTTKSGGIDVLLGAGGLLSSFAPRIPDVLVRSLADSFMFGSYATDQKEPFLLLKTDSYENAYAGMLSWEKTMGNELLPLFAKSLPSQEGAQPVWKDDILRNTDIRRFVDSKGTSLLVYSFLDRSTILITPSDVVFYEVLGRLHTPKPVEQ